MWLEAKLTSFYPRRRLENIYKLSEHPVSRSVFESGCPKKLMNTVTPFIQNK